MLRFPRRLCVPTQAAARGPLQRLLRRSRSHSCRSWMRMLPCSFAQ
jgi:hypothetical protein